jgi:hypothetical protein
MRAASVRDFLSVASQFSSVLVRERQAVLVERRVVRWEIVLRCVRANVVRCIRHARCRHREAARWAQAVREWLGVRWELDRDFRLRAPRQHVRVRVHRQRIAVLVSVIKVREVSRKDR